MPEYGEDVTVIEICINVEPTRELVKLPRAEWDAMTYAERTAFVDDCVDVAMGNAGGAGASVIHGGDDSQWGTAEPDERRPLITLVVTRSQYGSHRLGLPGGAELFSVHLSTQRGSHAAIIQTQLPMCRIDRYVDSAEDWPANAEAAHAVCARAYGAWLADNTGLTVVVEVDDRAVR